MDVLDLSRELLRFDTINPPGDERACAEHLGRSLENAGFDVRFYEYSPGRTSLVARLGGSSSRLPLCFAGHIDTVLGPGEMELAHQTDEYCRLDRLEQAVELYVKIARRWCGL